MSYPDHTEIIEMLRNTPLIGVEGFPQTEEEANNWTPPDHLIQIAHAFFVKGYNTKHFG